MSIGLQALLIIFATTMFVASLVCVWQIVQRERAQRKLRRELRRIADAASGKQLDVPTELEFGVRISKKNPAYDGYNDAFRLP